MFSVLYDAVRLFRAPLVIGGASRCIAYRSPDIGKIVQQKITEMSHNQVPRVHI